RRKVWELILAEVADRNVTVLISSHNLRELEDVCDHVGILYQGKMMLEKELDDIKGNIYKLQLAFSDGLPEELVRNLKVLHQDSLGSLHMLIVRGRQEQLAEMIRQYQPLLCDFLPLSLEEVFIYELGGIDHEIKNSIL
ncbi:MAG: ABC transporter ATP-binding protein, partial [Clostridia bacterium]|nr:ABC transporter ATP-binding protein [Clostridia bacterium]